MHSSQFAFSGLFPWKDTENVIQQCWRITAQNYGANSFDRCKDWIFPAFVRFDWSKSILWGSRLPLLYTVRLFIPAKPNGHMGIIGENALRLFTKCVSARGHAPLFNPARELSARRRNSEETVSTACCKHSRGKHKKLLEERKRILPQIQFQKQSFCFCRGSVCVLSYKYTKNRIF